MRKIIQICESSTACDSMGDNFNISALCNDGTTWYLNDVRKGWVKYPDIPQDEIELTKQADIGWISVEERLPELEDDGVSESLLLYGSEVFSSHKFRFVGYFNGEEFFTSDSVEMKVTHWHLLPAPPKNG